LSVSVSDFVVDKSDFVVLLITKNHTVKRGTCMVDSL
jgi:hypothetical protein